MPVTGKHRSPVETGISGWISIHISDEESSLEVAPAEHIMKRAASVARPAAAHPFDGARDAIVPHSERFPRFTFLAVALALLFSALTAEFDLLRGTGYYRP